MPSINFLQHGLEQFAQLESWNLPTLKLLENYLLNYQKVSSYEKLLHSMVLASDLHYPISISRKKEIYSPRLKNYVEMENAHRTLKRAEVKLYKRKLIDTVDAKGEKQLVVTSRGEKIFYRSYPLAKLRKQKWDGSWTIVMYDFPEKRRRDRNLLRRKLEGYGFGTPQRSIFISPLPLQKPIQQMIEGEKYQNFVWVTRAQTVLGKDSREIVVDAWPVESLNNLYERLVETFSTMPSDEELDLFWQTSYLAINNHDPYLPLELLPDPWHGEACRKLYTKVTRLGLLGAILG